MAIEVKKIYDTVWKISVCREYEEWPTGMYNWCVENFGEPGVERGWVYWNNRIILNSEPYLILFKLRWE